MMPGISIRANEIIEQITAAGSPVEVANIIKDADTEFTGLDLDCIHFTAEFMTQLFEDYRNGVIKYLMEGE